MLRYWLLLLCFLPVAAGAEDNREALCRDAITQAEITECSLANYKVADKALNDAYKIIRPTLTKIQRDSLRGVQLAWIKFRDSHCDHYALDAKGGSIYDAIRNDCLTEITWQRTETLKRQYATLFTGNATPEMAFPPADYNTPFLQPAQPAELVNAEDLIGKWKNLTEGYQLQLNFSRNNGQTQFSSWLNDAPFEAGIWQLQDEQLLITTSTGEVLHLYTTISLQNDLLILYEADGTSERYQRIP
ncbi:lysozyme inhibitor LprI family protein [Thioflexithrix psekupsensis]|uniref:Lysozyme inhibitor LprI-like N-terminal domain-containing protein n=1 Tax=Thioflexithrix psekupsensis TaxID=1570016 RepID=A0A251X8J8_9GAMM|nr:lysozyme inhibitor LprI family protein [Thioflexithrix psekupsensis]OUD14260.1 hypothetical protein TPSD3_08005 [Thioflexithrix psekupsensis]